MTDSNTDQSGEVRANYSFTVRAKDLTFDEAKALIQRLRADGLEVNEG